MLLPEVLVHPDKEPATLVWEICPQEVSKSQSGGLLGTKIQTIGFTSSISSLTSYHFAALIDSGAQRGKSLMRYPKPGFSFSSSVHNIHMGQGQDIGQQKTTMATAHIHHVGRVVWWKLQSMSSSSAQLILSPETDCSGRLGGGHSLTVRLRKGEFVQKERV